MKLRRFLPIIIIALLMVIAYFTGLTSLLSWETIKANRDALHHWVQENPRLAPMLFICSYILIVALSIPGAAFISILGGFLFPQPWATLYVMVGATLGAIIIFSAARTAFGNVLREKAGTTLRAMEEGFQRNAASYLLFLRLVPAFPFWLVNLAPAIFGVSLWTFTWTTFIGIAPGAFVFTQAGFGLAEIEELSVGAILNPQMRIALVALGLFALMPIAARPILRRWLGWD